MKLLPLALALCAPLLAFAGADDHNKAPEVGKPAPTFSLNSFEGQKISVGGGGSWTVVAFYPKAMTPG